MQETTSPKLCSDGRIMKLLKPSGRLFPDGGGNVKQQTTLVEGQGTGFWTWVRFPSSPLERMAENMVFSHSFFIS